MRLVEFLESTRLDEVTAYHGTPHKFWNFDIQKIGTGEGAQVYGYGLYFAENPVVAKAYYNQLTDPVKIQYSPMTQKKMMPKWEELAARHEQIHQAWISAVGNPEERKRLEAEREALEDQMDAYQQEMMKAGSKKEGGGFIYIVRISEEVLDRMLGWDYPMGDQPDNVKEAFKKIDPIFTSEEPHFVNSVGQAQHWSEFFDSKEEMTPRNMEVVKNIQSKKSYPGEWMSYGEYVLNHSNETGGEYYRGMRERLEREADSPDVHANKEVAMLLHNAGIPGIRYLDQLSRTGQSGDMTENFVLFDDKYVEVLRRTDGSEFGHDPDDEDDW